MNKTIIRIALAAVFVSMFAFTGSVFAQAEVPPAGPASTEPLYLNHDEMVSALADLTGLSVEEVETRLAAGETGYQIAASAGVSLEDFQAVMPMGGYGYGMQAAGQGGYGRMNTTGAPRFQMQQQAQYLLETGECINDGVPQPQNLNLQDGSGAGRGGRWNR